MTNNKTTLGDFQSETEPDNETGTDTTTTPSTARDPRPTPPAHNERNNDEPNNEIETEIEIEKKIDPEEEIETLEIQRGEVSPGVLINECLIEDWRVDSPIEVLDIDLEKEEYQTTGATMIFDLFVFFDGAFCEASGPRLKLGVLEGETATVVLARGSKTVRFQLEEGIYYLSSVNWSRVDPEEYVDVDDSRFRERTNISCRIPNWFSNDPHGLRLSEGKYLISAPDTGFFGVECGSVIARFDLESFEHKELLKQKGEISEIEEQFYNASSIEEIPNSPVKF